MKPDAPLISKKDKKLRKFCVKYAAKHQCNGCITDTAQRIYLFIHDGWDPFDFSDLLNKESQEQKI